MCYLLRLKSTWVRPFTNLTLDLLVCCPSALRSMLGGAAPDAMINRVQSVVHHAAHLSNGVERLVDEGVERHFFSFFLD